MAQSSMTEIALSPKQGTVGFEYKVPNGQYEYGYMIGSIYIPFEADPDDLDLAKREGAVALEAAKQLVFTALGVEYEVWYDADGVEQTVALIKKVFGPGVKVETKNADGVHTTSGGRPANDGGSSKVTVLRPIDDHPIPDWLDDQWQAQVDAGKAEASDNEVWDNRKFLPLFGGRGKNNQPWFRTSKGKVGVWPPKS